MTSLHMSASAGNHVAAYLEYRKSAAVHLHHQQFAPLSTLLTLFPVLRCYA